MTKPDPRGVFLNIPYSRSYERLFVAYIAAVTAQGLIPRAVLEITGSQRRLDRIIQLVRKCRYSIHDLSHVGLDGKPPRTPRFNMPFELGLAIGLKQEDKARRNLFVFETRPYRLQKSLSDLNGTDPLIHGHKPGGILTQLASAFAHRRRTVPAAALNRTYEVLWRNALELRRIHHAETVFEASVFQELRTQAVEVVNHYLTGG
jgi:hypothetical protein